MLGPTMSTFKTPHQKLAMASILVFALLARVGAQAQLGPPPVPPGNPLTPAKVQLGKTLFWDEQLSSTRTVSCGTCHIPTGGGNDPRSLTSPMALHPGPDGIFGNADDALGSPGVPLSDASGLYLWNADFGLTEQATPRRTVSSINAGYTRELFWDGRAGQVFIDPVTQDVVLAAGAALETQALFPLVSEVEMGHQGRTWGEVLARVAAAEPLALAPRAPFALLSWIDGRGYPELFAEAFGTPEITAARIGMAIASYERTQFTNQTPFDDFLAGQSSLTALEAQGRSVFTASSCDRCHSLAIMTDNSFRYTGVRPPAEDPGRFTVTNLAADLGRMRTPSLRNLELRAPYMHNGRFETIEAVVDFYDRGGDFDAPNKDPLVRPLLLSQAQKDALVAFLKRPLTDPRLAAELPPFDRPRLYTESPRVPVIEGTGLAGSGGEVPQVTALEPPLLGSPGFTVGVHHALGGANALLAIDDVDPGLTPPGSADFAFENVVLEGVGAGEGFGSVSLVIPDDPALLGKQWFGRWYVTDTGGGGSVAVSPVFRFRVFRSLGDSVVFLDGFESGNPGAWSNTVP